MIDPLDRYWIVATNPTQRWAGARGVYVNTSDSAYIAWDAIDGNDASNIATESELWTVLAEIARSLYRNGGYTSYTPGTDLTLTNPLTTEIQISTTAPGLTITLPPMNLPVSPPLGVVFFIRNVGSNFFAVKKSDGTTITVLSSGHSLSLRNRSFATASGDFFRDAFVHDWTNNATAARLAMALDQVNNTADAVKTTGFKNILARNGGMEVWQRGAGDSASIAVAASTVAYTADGWYLATAANQASVVAAASPLAHGGAKAAKVQRNSGETGTGTMRFAIPLEPKEVFRLRGKTVLLSFLAKAGANWSPASGTLIYNLYCGTAAAAKRNATAYTSETNPITGSINLTSTVSQAISAISVPIGSSITQAELQCSWTPTGTAGADDSFTIDDVQLEHVASGVAPTSVVFEVLPFPMMMFLCKAQFQKSFPYSTAPAQNTGNAGVLATFAASTLLAATQIRVLFIPSMLATPTVAFYNPGAANANWRDLDAVADLNAGGSQHGSPDGITIYNNGTVTADRFVGVHATFDAGL